MMLVTRDRDIPWDVYLKHAAERYQDWLERGDREVAAVCKSSLAR